MSLSKHQIHQLFPPHLVHLSQCSEIIASIFYRTSLVKNMLCSGVKFCLLNFFKLNFLLWNGTTRCGQLGAASSLLPASHQVTSANSYHQVIAGSQHSQHSWRDEHMGKWVGEQSTEQQQLEASHFHTSPLPLPPPLHWALSCSEFGLLDGSGNVQAIFQQWARQAAGRWWRPGMSHFHTHFATAASNSSHSLACPPSATSNCHWQVVSTANWPCCPATT